MKELKINEDYGFCFGVEAGTGKSIIYLGGNKWKGENNGKTLEMDSQAMTTNALEYINRRTVQCGTIG